jgi:hypothetical protein
MYAGTRETTAGTVCKALRRHGARVDPVVSSAAAHRAAYVVSLQPSGRSWSLAVTYEEPVGNPVKTRRVQLDLPSDLSRRADELAQAQMKEESESSTEVEAPAEFGFTLDGWLGGGNASLVDGSGGGGPATGATALFQYKWLDAGLGASAMTDLFGPSSSLLGVLVGVRFDPVPWFRFDLLAESGAHTITDAGASFGSTIIRGGDATLPYLGGRAGASFLIGRRPRFVLGWWANAGRSLGRRTVQATVEDCLSCDSRTETHSVGGPSFMTGLRLGAFFH